MWDCLRKSLNGIVNKVNTSNIQHIVMELFNENLMRGKGLLIKALCKAQAQSPTFTHVYAALVCAINSKLPDIGELLLHRTVAQFLKGFRRNSKLVCKQSLSFIAHLVNQQVVHELIALQLLSLFLTKPTGDSIELACDFLQQCGQCLQEVTQAGCDAIFTRFRQILQEGQISKRVQYVVEKLFQVRKDKFKDFPGIVPELDFVEEGDKITHNLALDDELDCMEALNNFKYDPDFEQRDAEWDEIRKEIVGDYFDQICL